MGIIKPILNDDVKNIRPITISDCISNVFETIVLNRIMVEYDDLELQFVIKKNSSYAHAIYSEKTIQRHQRKRKRRVLLCAIDASKVNRDKMLDKLNGRIDDNLWLVIKSFYD